METTLDKHKVRQNTMRSLTIYIYILMQVQFVKKQHMLPKHEPSTFCLVVRKMTYTCTYTFANMLYSTLLYCAMLYHTLLIVCSECILESPKMDPRRFA